MKISEERKTEVKESNNERICKKMK